MNSVELAGTLVRLPESKTVGQNNTLLVKFAIATERPDWNGSRETHVIEVQAFGKTAQAVTPLKVGDFIGFKGWLKSRSYKDRTGNERASFDITATEVWKYGGGGGYSSGTGYQPNIHDQDPDAIPF